MNKSGFSMLLFLLLFVDATRAQRTMCLQTMVETNGVGKTTPTRDIEETPNGVTVTYRFNNVVLQEDPLNTDAITVKIDGFWPNKNIGEPAVLSRWDTFVVPESGAKIVICDSSYVELPIELSPARPVQINGGNDSYNTDNVIPIAGFKGFFPSSLISAIRNDSYRGQQLLDVGIAPIQYDFVNKKVRVFTMIQYNIQYNVETLKNSLSRSSIEKLSENTFLNNIALNYPSKKIAQKNIASTSSTEIINSKYLIISVPKYSIAVNRFAEWKRTLGFDVHIEMRESWDTTMVKNVVQAAYATNDIDFLLIVGGQSDVPGLIRERYINGVNRLHPTDLYYGCLDSGYTPDIFRGRILVGTSNEAMTVVDKIINYEKNPVTDDSFYRTSVHCAYFQDQEHFDSDLNLIPRDGYEDRRFVLTSERIRNGMLTVIDSVKRVYYTKSNIYPRNWNQYDYANGEEIPEELKKPTFAWNGNYTDINNSINQKAFYILMRDHGDVDKWEYPAYSVSNISNLNNGSYLPVVFSICCLTGKYDENNCFCESFLKKEDGGCVAIYGASQVSLSGPNDVMSEGMFDAIWPSLNLRPAFGNIDSTNYSPTPAPTYRLGQILDQGLRRSSEAYSTVSGKAWYPRYTSELFHCFGDPSMMIYTEKPTSFSNASINRLSDGTISVNTGGILATITFYNRRTGDVRSYRGYSISHTGDPETSVCISAHNKIPFLDEGTLYIQNKTLTNGGYYEAKTIKVGKNVTTTQSQGDVIFSQGEYHIIGETIELQSGTTISVGTTMEIKNKQ